MTRSKTLPCHIRDFNTLHKGVTELRKTLNLNRERIRLPGVTISNLETDSDNDYQLDLFDSP